MTEKSVDLNWYHEDKPASVRPRPAVPVPVRPDNRRRYTRFEIDSSQVKLHRRGLLSALNLRGNKALKVCDLSQGGARILATERIPAKQKIQLKITLEKYQDQVEIGGEVVWCYSASNRKDFLVGVRFSTDDSATARKMAALQEWFTSPQYQALRSRR
jgi:hypothetical protein